VSKGRTRRLDTRIGKASTVLREFYHPVVTKQELSNTANLSVFKSVFVPILTYGHESCVMTETVLLKYKWEMLFGEKFTARHFTIKCTAVKFIKPCV